MKKEVFLLFLVNLSLVCVLLLLLNKIGAVEFSFLQPHNKPVGDNISQDPFLMEREALKKQWAVLMSKETDLQERQASLDKNSQELQEKQKEVNAQLEAIENSKKESENAIELAKKDEASIRSIAEKINNIPPVSGAAILNDMDPVVAVETIKIMDKISQENGTPSITAYLLSLMDSEKRKEVVRLMSAYPSNLDDLNIPSPDIISPSTTENSNS